MRTFVNSTRVEVWQNKIQTRTIEVELVFFEVMATISKDLKWWILMASSGHVLINRVAIQYRSLFIISVECTRYIKALPNHSYNRCCLRLQTLIKMTGYHVRGLNLRFWKGMKRGPCCWLLVVDPSLWQTISYLMIMSLGFILNSASHLNIHTWHMTTFSWEREKEKLLHWLD